MPKSRLLTPGPTLVPERVLRALGSQALHHRGPEFKELMHEVQTGLKEFFQTQEEVMILSSSGTGAMEACVANLFSRGDHVLVLNAGKFGERWTKIAQAYDLRVSEIRVERGYSVSVEQVATALEAHPDLRGVLFQASETSTGVKLPTREICELTRARPGCLAVVDAITALGVFDLPMDAWRIDALITGSQKALMLPPGLACVALSRKAWAATETSDLPKFYFDLSRERKAATKGQTAWTPPIGLVMGLRESLAMLKEEGREQTYARHRMLAEATRAGIVALGLELLGKEHPSEAVTAVRVPASILDGKALPKLLREKYNVTISGGQDELEGKIFRLTHLGYLDEFDVLTGITALELALWDLGHRAFQLGAGAAAALRAIHQSKNQV